MGLRFSPQFAQQVLQGVRQMRESSTYQFILDEGRAEGRAEGEARGRSDEARRLILRQGTKRFGAPDAATEAALAAVDTVERLEQLAERLLEAESWAELLA